MARILLLGGPAGVGKSHFASRVLKSRDWEHLEFDEYSGGRVDPVLHRKWEAFYCHHEAIEFHKELRKQYSRFENLVVTLTGKTLFGPDHISAAKGLFHIAYLWGKPEDCLEAFLERERLEPRGLDYWTWIQNNRDTYLWFDLSFSKVRRVNAFADDGSRRPNDDVFRDLDQIMS